MVTCGDNVCSRTETVGVHVWQSGYWTSLHQEIKWCSSYGILALPFPSCYCGMWIWLNELSCSC